MRTTPAIRRQRELARRRFGTGELGDVDAQLSALLLRRYGRAVDDDPRRPAVSVAASDDDATPPPRASGAVEYVVDPTADDRGAAAGGGGAAAGAGAVGEEYVVERTAGGAGSTSGPGTAHASEDYVVDAGGASPDGAGGPVDEGGASSDEGGASVDEDGASVDDGSDGTAPSVRSLPAPTPADGEDGGRGGQLPSEGPEGSAPPAAAPPAAGAAPSAAAGDRTTADRGIDEDDLAADLAAILSGEKVYSEQHGKVVDRAVATERPAATRGRRPAAEPAGDDDRHEIFDRIARSMQHANAYDLGEVELQRRFDRFDRDAADGPGSAKPASAMSSTVAPAAGPGAQREVSTTDFIADLDRIAARGAATTAASLSWPVVVADSLGVAMCATVATTQSVGAAATQVGMPLAEVADHLNVPPLRVGRDEGVACTYADVLVLPVAYETVDQLLAAPAEEVGPLLTLARRTRDPDPSAWPSTAEWAAATAGRTLTVAEGGADHDAADGVAKQATLRQGDLRSSWERHHRRALREASVAAVDPSAVTRAHVVGAFGDHYLLDAFDPGRHLNREATAALVGERFHGKGGGITPAASAFIERVAVRALDESTAERLAGLAGTPRPVSFAGLTVPWTGGLDSPASLASVLERALATDSDRIAGLVTAVLRAQVRRDGVAVTTDDGEAWQLGGTDDGPARQVATRALTASVADVTTALGGTPYDADAVVDATWRSVPRLTDEAAERLRALVETTVDPTSTILSDAVGDLVARHLVAIADTVATPASSTSPPPEAPPAGA